jgi:hypothetical protein
VDAAIGSIPPLTSTSPAQRATVLILKDDPSWEGGWITGDRREGWTMPDAHKLYQDYIRSKKWALIKGGCPDRS